jgi:2-phospho-L-lactate/phosphoenolpyruvate guanylyltransferase
VNVWAVVPQKSLATAKGRLSDVLSRAARAQLSLRLLQSVCRALGAVDSVKSVTVMTPDPNVQRHAVCWGVRATVDQRPDLNAALAALLARLAGPDHGLLVVAADLPLLRPTDVAALIACGAPQNVVLAASKDGTGTNALLLPPGVAMPPAYGPGSLFAHRQRARHLGLGIVEIRRPGLGFDVDTPGDLTGLERMG